MTNPMTPTEQDKELRAGLIDIVGQHLAKWRGTTPLEDYANVDDVYRTLTPELEEYVTQLIATHDQQLLEAILDGKQTLGRIGINGVRVDFSYVPVEHVKSVFHKEGEFIEAATCKDCKSVTKPQQGEKL